MNVESNFLRAELARRIRTIFPNGRSSPISGWLSMRYMEDSLAGKSERALSLLFGEI